MDIYIYQEKTRKVKGEDSEYLEPIAELEDFDSVEEALEALMDQVPDLLGVELAVFTQAPMLITANENPSKYAFVNGGVSTVDEPEAAEPEDEPAEEAPKPARRGRPRGRSTTAKRPRKTTAKKSPFKSNPASAE
jgi:hypothetical protein